MKQSKLVSLKTISGAALAFAAAGMFLGGMSAAANAAEEGKVHCVGVNGCKGKSECATAKSSCKGQNDCKGHGFLSMTEKECKEKKGTVEMDKMDKKS